MAATEDGGYRRGRIQNQGGKGIRGERHMMRSI